MIWLWSVHLITESEYILFSKQDSYSRYMTFYMDRYKILSPDQNKAMFWQMNNRTIDAPCFDCNCHRGVTTGWLL